MDTVFGTVATAIPEQTVLIWRDRRLSYAQLAFGSQVDAWL